MRTQRRQLAMLLLITECHLALSFLPALPLTSRCSPQTPVSACQQRIRNFRSSRVALALNSNDDQQEVNSSSAESSAWDLLLSKLPSTVLNSSPYIDREKLIDNQTLPLPNETFSKLQADKESSFPYISFGFPAFADGQDKANRSQGPLNSSRSGGDAKESLQKSGGLATEDGQIELWRMVDQVGVVLDQVRELLSQPQEPDLANAIFQLQSAVLNVTEDLTELVRSSQSLQGLQDMRRIESRVQELTLKELEEARRDLALSAIKVANLEKKAATLGIDNMTKSTTIRLKEEGKQDAANTSAGRSRTSVPSVSVERQGTKTLIRIEEDPTPASKRQRLANTVGSFLGHLNVFRREEKEMRQQGGDETNRTRQELRERKGAAAAEDGEADEQRPKGRFLDGVAEIKHAWYGSERDLEKLSGRQEAMGRAKAARDEDKESGLKNRTAMEQVWQNLWGSGEVGKDVTSKVLSALRLVPKEQKDGRTLSGFLFLPFDLNQLLGDPAFGANKLLVVEYLDREGNNMTAIWSEKDAIPQTWKNQDMYDIFMQIVRATARQAVDGGQGRPELAEEGQGGLQKQEAKNTPQPRPSPPDGRAEAKVNASEGRGMGGADNVTEDGGNVWLKQVLWLPDEALKDEVWMARDPQLFDQQEPVADVKAPPPVIPFIKYASTGPPRSPWTSPDCSLPEFRILSLDGGGVRGILSAVILARLLKAVPTFLDNVDLLAGTSTGGLIALMLAVGYTPEECQKIYEYACPLIFAKDPWRIYNPLKAKYSPKGREDLCRTYLGEDRTLSDLKKHVVVTSFKLDGKTGNMGAFINMNGGWRPAVFSNIPKLDGVIEPDLNLYAWDAALRTSAAPTYFPSHRGYVDGAMFANNPSMLAVSKACAHFPRVTPENVVVLSVGAGNFPIAIHEAEEQDLDWGIKDWVPYIFDLMLDGDSISSELLLRYMLNAPSRGFHPDKRYYRIEPTLRGPIELDSVESIPELVRLGNAVDLSEGIAFVQRHFSSGPASASDAFAQAAVKTASWARQQALKVQLSEIIGSFTAIPTAYTPPWPVGVPSLWGDDAGGKGNASQTGQGKSK
eukprot:768319-Hanusia_phi.AAC.1